MLGGRNSHIGDSCTSGDIGDIGVGCESERACRVGGSGTEARIRPEDPKEKQPDKLNQHVSTPTNRAQTSTTTMVPSAGLNLSCCGPSMAKRRIPLNYHEHYTDLSCVALCASSNGGGHLHVCSLWLGAHERSSVGDLSPRSSSIRASRKAQSTRRDLCIAAPLSV
jgi:hypothetical protein